MAKQPDFPATNFSEPFVEGKELPGKIYLPKNKDGVVSVTLARQHGESVTFQLAFTTLAKAKKFVEILRQPAGPMRVTEFLEADTQAYLDRPNPPRVAIDVDPSKLLLN